MFDSLPADLPSIAGDLCWWITFLLMAVTPATLTPPELARRWRVKSEKILRFIRAGELRAFDVSTKPGVGRPRFRIPLDAITEFESRRTHKPATKPARRKRRRNAEVVEFF